MKLKLQKDCRTLNVIPIPGEGQLQGKGLSLMKSETWRTFRPWITEILCHSQIQNARARLEPLPIGLGLLAHLSC